jgi:hypothetical protein
MYKILDFQITPSLLGGPKHDIFSRSCVCQLFRIVAPQGSIDTGSPDLHRPRDVYIACIYLFQAAFDYV